MLEVSGEGFLYELSAANVGLINNMDKSDFFVGVGSDGGDEGMQR